MILGFVEHNGDKLSETSLEMLALGRDLAREMDVPLEAILIGEERRSLAEGLRAYGVSRVTLAQHEGLTDYAPEAWARCIAQVMGADGAQIVMAAGTDRGNEIMAHVAARSDLPMAANCLSVEPGEPMQLTRMRWGGSLVEEATLSGSPKLLTVAPHVFPAEASAMPAEIAVNTVAADLEEKDFQVRVSGRVDTAGDKISLAEARVVVGGGRGVGSREGFESLDELAHLLGGAVGCSRVVTNHGWRPHADQIGQTGSRIAPDLYIACGISGAVQHSVGCKGSKKILVINTDPEAPILAMADYAIIGDLHEVVPALVEEIRAARG